MTRGKCKHGGAHGKGGCWRCLAALLGLLQ